MTRTNLPGMKVQVTSVNRKCVKSDVIIIVVTCVICVLMSSADAVNLSQVDGKRLFHSLRASQSMVDCVTSKTRPVCGSDDITYPSRCELKRAKKCNGKRIKVKHKGPCETSSSHKTQCLSEHYETSAKNNSRTHVPTCNQDGSYSEVQCHEFTGYCWCVLRDGRHIPGTSVAGGRPPCEEVKEKGKKKRKKTRTGKTRRKKSACTNTDRQTFNAALIKQFKEEYERVNPTAPPSTGTRADKFGTEKAIVVWKFKQLDKNKDNMLKFKEIRNFGRMVRKLIKPKPCAKKFLKYCDKNRTRTIEEREWTMCLGVDIKSNSLTHEFETMTKGFRTSPLLQSDDLPLRNGRLGPSQVERNGDRRAEKAKTCSEQRELALDFKAQIPDAKPFIPECTRLGEWKKDQCHDSAGYCWCVEQSTGDPIPYTATYKVRPNCTFENEREMKGCPLQQKRRFLVNLIGELTRERQKALISSGNKTNDGPEDNLSLRETVARWKLKTLDKNNNGVLERKEWRPLRKTTLKSKKYPRKCRRSFLRYCDMDKNKKITHDEWKDCLGLKNNYYNSLPVNPNRHGEKNPFINQLT